MTEVWLVEWEIGMQNEKYPWFIPERSKALAALLLTSRDEVHVQSERVKEEGVDLLVEIDQGDALSTRLFVVQVKGTLSSEKNEWMESAGQLFKVGPQSIDLPACIIVVNVRNNNADYAWLAEPLIQDQKARLKFHAAGDFHALTPQAVDEIINRVKAWYDVLPQQLTPTSS
jgi:hypothetical protein